MSKIKFKYSIGEAIVDEKRKFIILEREIRQKEYKNGTIRKYKWYKCLCKNCGWDEHWIEEGHLKDRGCPCCANKICICGINDIGTKRPDLIKYFVNKEDAFTHTTGSGEKAKTCCPFCGLEKNLTYNYICRYGFGCINCSDSLSYPNKFMKEFCSQLLEQKQIKNYKLEYKIEDRFFDILITLLNNETLIIENHGEQHGKWCRNGDLVLMKEGNSFYKKKNKEVSDIKNDSYKCKIAYEYGITNYIQLDCSRSEMNYIKKSIENSILLNKLFNLKNINWRKCEEHCSGNIEKEICNLYNKLSKELKREVSPNEIIKRYNLPYGRNLVYNSLLKGNKLKWCKYEGKCQRVGSIVSIELVTGKVKIWDCSISNIARSFGVKKDGHISSCCKHKRETCYNHFWYYLKEWDELTKEEKDNIIEKAKFGGK